MPEVTAGKWQSQNLNPGPGLGSRGVEKIVLSVGLWPLTGELLRNL